MLDGDSRTLTKILGLLKYFGEDYRDTLASAVDKSWTEALDSIVNNKNDIAHGKGSKVTLSDAKSFHLQARKVFEELDKILM